MLPEHPEFHPGNWGLVEVYRATGHLRSSACHNWPLTYPAVADVDAVRRYIDEV